MCSLTAGRYIQPFTGADDCQPSGLPFAVKNDKRVLQAAERAEKMLLLSISERIKDLGITPESDLNPAVVLKPMSPEHISSTPGSISGTDDNMTDVEPDEKQAEEIPVTNTKSKNTGRASKKGLTEPGGGQKKEVMKQLKKSDRKTSVGKRKSRSAGVDSLSSSQKNVDGPHLVASGASSVPDNAEQNPKGSSLTAEQSSDKRANAGVKRKTDSSTGMDKQQAANVIGLQATTAKIKHHESPKTAAEKKKSGKSRDMSTMEKSGGTERPKKDAAGSVNVLAASLMKGETQKHVYEDKNYSAKSEATNANNSVGDKGNKDKPQSATHSVSGVPAPTKRKAGNSDSDTHDADAECGSQLEISGFKQEDLDISPAKSQKLQQSYTAESLADGNNMDMTSNNNSIISQPVTNSLKLDVGIGKRGRSTSRRQYANVGNRAPSASGTPCLVEGGFSVVRGRGGGRPRGSRSVGFTYQQGMGASTGPYGARGATSAHRAQRGGMPVRGHGRMHVVGGLPHCPSQMMPVRNSTSTSGSGDGTSYGESHQPRTLMTGAAVQNVPVFKPVMNSASVSSGEYFTPCCIMLYIVVRLFSMPADVVDIVDDV